MSLSRHAEVAFETVIEAHLLEHDYVSVAREGLDRERAVFPEIVLAFIRGTQAKEWAKLEALHGEKTGEQVLGDLCRWMDQLRRLLWRRSTPESRSTTLEVIS